MKRSYYICPICNKHKFTESGTFDVCPNCGWENDAVMNDDPSYFGGANDLCQLDFKLRYKYYLSKNSNYHWARDLFPDVPQIEETACPVCKKMQFTPLDWSDIYCGIVPSDVHCQYCGWKYDAKQIESPNIKDGANHMSLNEYRVWYENKIKQDPNYIYFEETTDDYVSNPHNCPVCGKYEFEDYSSHDICPFCGWEDDGVQTDDPDYIGGANPTSLNQYKVDYAEKISRNPFYRWDKEEI